MEFSNITHNGHPATQLIDQLGRKVILEFAPGGDLVRVPGVGGAELVYEIHWKSIQVYKTYSTVADDHYSPEGYPDILGSQFVVSEIELPAETGGLKYLFGYNAVDTGSTPCCTPSYGWGELNSVTTPAGAQAQYQYQMDGQNGPGFGYTWDEVLRNRVTQKTLTYQQQYDGTSTPVTDTWSYTASTIVNPDGGIISQFSDTQRNYRTQHPDGTVVEKLWQANRPQAFPATGAYDQYTGIDAYDPQRANGYVKTEFTSIRNAAGNLTKTAIKDYSYDKNGNVTSVAEYDWVDYGSVPRGAFDLPAGIPAGAVLKRVTTSTFAYATPNASDTSSNDVDSYWNSTAPILRTAVASSEVSNGSTTFTRTEFVYDNAATTGNLTQQKSWDSTKGAYSNPLSGSNSIAVSHQYDGYGNPTLSTDARGYQTQFVYGSINGFTDLYPTQIKTAYQTSVQRTETREYDFSTGAVTRATDVDNNVSSAMTYDVFGRPTLVKNAEGKPEETRTSTIYSDVNRRVIVKSDLNTLGDEKLVSIQHYDQLGRVRLARQLEDAATQSATDEMTGIKVQTRYQYSGNFSYVLNSNPYRAATSGAAGSEATMGWTRSKTNNGGQMIEVQTFAGATAPAPWGTNSSSTGTVTTAYDANFTTVTDQAGKLRRSMVDALGQLVRVDEPDASNSLGTTAAPVQPTSYSYNVLGNLITVSQGAQTRTFTYDSLSRLTTSANPESGAITYNYDNNGNVITRQDARPVTTTITYDALNRPTAKTYSDGTPRIDYVYDTQSLPAGAPTFDRGYAKGRLVAVNYGGGSAGTYRGYDPRGLVLRQYQQTDSVNYLAEATYRLNGSLQTETYPSVPVAGDRRTITYSSDNAGRLASLSAPATTYAPAASVSGISYTAPGTLSSQTYGNSLIHAVTYNSRLQTSEIKLGTGGSPTSVVSIAYNYGTTNNNGNVQSITYAGGGLSYTQSFGYDSLNRLTTSNENSGANWSQTNGYDRYGNRWIDLGGGNQSLYFTASNNRITGSSYDAAGNLLNDGTHAYTYNGENKITKVDNVNAYVYDGEGQRVRKLIGENLRFVYGIGGQLIMEFSGATGALTKEYIYGAGGLLATIEPTAVNANGTRYTTADHLSSPRVVTNSSAGVVSRHDYMPFGEELGAGIGGRTTAMGFPGTSDGLRQKFTSKERDAETGLDYFEARYYANSHGRFTSTDPLLTSGRPNMVQSWNRYAYVLNNPLALIDPDGLEEVEPQSQQVEEIGKDVIINKKIKEIEDKAKPLAPGTTAVPTKAVIIPGEQTQLNNAIIKGPDGENVGTGISGYMQPVALVVLDQGGNIMKAPNDMFVVEDAKPANAAAEQEAKAGRLKTTNQQERGQSNNGAFYDIQMRGLGQKPLDLRTTQDLKIRHYFGPKTTDFKEIFQVTGNKIRFNDHTMRITFTPGKVKKL